MPKLLKSCWYCGCELRDRFTTRDHQIPSSRGGKNDSSNLVDCCRNCNEEKGAMNVEEYRTFVWLQKIGSPQFSREQVQWLKQMEFQLTVEAYLMPSWDGKFFGEKVAAPKTKAV